MQTFGLTLQIRCTSVIAKQFLAEARKEAQAPEASLFLKTIQEKFPEDDDQFMLAIVKNSYRTTLRRGLLEFMHRSGVGGTVSPVQIVEESIHAGAGAVAEFATATDPDAPKDITPSKAVQLRIDKDSPGVQVAGLIESRKE